MSNSKLLNAIIDVLSSSANGGGVFIAAELSKKSIANIYNYCDENNIRYDKKDKLHCTIVYDNKSKIAHSVVDIKRTYSTPIIIKPSEMEFDMLGEQKNCLVIKFNKKALNDRFKTLHEEYGFVYDWPEYNSHITLSYTADNMNIADLPPIDFNIVITGEYIESAL